MSSDRRPKKPPRPAARRDRAGGLLTDPETARPLASLVFLSPLLAFYAFGLIWVRPDLAAGADLLLRKAIQPLGLTGILAPTWLVVIILVVWHLLRRDPTRVRPGLLLRMLLETVVLSVPLLFILAASTIVLHGFLALELPAGRATAPAGWLAISMTSIGAGLYEELLFRLLMVGGPVWLARKVLGSASDGVVVAVVLVAAAVFAGAHTLEDPRRFAWDSFLFRTAAGTYLGYVFARRGFGIAVGVHVVFDLVVKFAVVSR